MKKKENTNYPFESCIEIGNDNIEERKNQVLQEYTMYGTAFYEVTLQFQGYTQLVNVDVIIPNIGMLNYENKQKEIVYIGDVDIEKNEYFLFDKPIIKTMNGNTQLVMEQIQKALFVNDINKRFVGFR